MRYLEGGLDREQIPVLAHLDGCDHCREFVSALAADPVLADAAGVTRIGRFVLLAPIGEGAMGIVYRAYDPDLDRAVALKIVRGVDDEVAYRRRLLREAQAMARVSHANVVPVYEAGRAGDEVYLAMELIDGVTLDAWLAQRPRSIDQIVAVFVQAGRGLASAHAAGIVHRDFKPGNVLIDRNDRARVTDFGLAIAAPQREPVIETSTADVGELAPPAASSTSMRDGRPGTPAYMSPEQRASGVVDERSDQYSFCVALYEALHRTRPGDAGGPRGPRAGSEVPRWLDRAIARGLAADPSRRWTSMTELLTALDRRPVRRRRLVVALVAVAAGLASAGALAGLPADRADVCGEGDIRMAAVWNPPRRQAVIEAFARTGAPGAEAAGRAVSRSLDRTTNRWRAMRREACEAVRIRGELADRRTECLDRRLGEADAAIEVLTTADAATVARGVSAAQLGNLEDCGNAVALAAQRPPSPDIPRARLVELQQRADHVSALAAAGKHDDAEKLFAPLLTELAGVDDAGLLSQVILARARVLIERGTREQAERALLETIAVSDRAGRDGARMSAWLLLTQLHAQGGDFEAAARALAQARATVARMGDPPASLSVIIDTEAVLLGWQQRPEEALERSRQALALIVQAGPDEQIANVRMNLAMSLVFTGHASEAVVHAEQAVHLLEQLSGGDGPDLAIALKILGQAQEGAGKDELARQTYQASIDMQRRVLGPDHLATTEVETLLGTLLDRTGSPRDALPILRRSLAVREAAVGTSDVSLFVELRALGFALRHAGHPVEALRVLERALAVCDGNLCLEEAEVRRAMDDLRRELPVDERAASM